jgi:phage-related protein
MNERKVLQWIGSARQEVRGLSAAARQKAGADLWRVQNGGDPKDWKPMESVGPGAREIRIRTADGGSVQHRVIYVAKFPEAVYVLHAFEKKTRRTSPHNIEVAALRYRQLLQLRASLANPGKEPQ